MQIALTSSPEVIVLLSAGTVPEIGSDGKTTYRSTTYEHRDGFGVLGNHVRVEATALLAKAFPQSKIITTGKRNPGEPTHAAILASELETRGVHESRIMREEKSENTFTQITETLKICAAQNYVHIIYVSNEYHIPRIQAMIANISRYMSHDKEAIEAYEKIEATGSIGTLSAEEVILEHRPGFTAEFEEVKHRPAYKERLAAEKRGLEMINDGTYGTIKSLPEDKLERSV